jgi:hypothetical protein
MQALRSVSASSAQSGSVSAMVQSGSVSQSSVSAMHFTKQICKNGGLASI